MTGRLHVFHDPPLTGPDNMARDEHLLRSPALRPAALRLYAWDPPTISLGYFQRHTAVAELPADVRDLAVVRRPTGGGAILHDQEITYCLVVDASLPIMHRAPTELYELAHGAWRAVLLADRPDLAAAPDALPFPSPRSGPFFCFEKPGRTDLVLGEQKVLGSAQRRLPDRVMQHGSLLLGRRFATHPGAQLDEQRPEVLARWQRAFVAKVAIALDLSPETCEWTGDMLADVAERRVKYAGREWTQLR